MESCCILNIRSYRSTCTLCGEGVYDVLNFEEVAGWLQLVATIRVRAAVGSSTSVAVWLVTKQRKPSGLPGSGQPTTWALL